MTIIATTILLFTFCMLSWASWRMGYETGKCDQQADMLNSGYRKP